MSGQTETCFQHRFDDVTGYLHHRAPYLLIDEVLEIEPSSVRTSATVKDDTFYSKGHFPGAPVLPGAMMQEMTTQSAGVLIAANFNPMEHFDTEDPFANEMALGVLVKIKHARYRGFARPGDQLVVSVSLAGQAGNLFDFNGQIRCNEQTIYRNQFQLANVPSSTLRG